MARDNIVTLHGIGITLQPEMYSKMTTTGTPVMTNQTKYS